MGRGRNQAALDFFLLDIQKDALIVVNAVRIMDCGESREIIVSSVVCMGGNGQLGLV